VNKTDCQAYEQLAVQTTLDAPEHLALFSNDSGLGRVFSPSLSDSDPPQPPRTKVSPYIPPLVRGARGVKGENERQSPPVLLEVLGKQSYTLAFERFLRGI